MLMSAMAAFKVLISGRVLLQLLLTALGVPLCYFAHYSLLQVSVGFQWPGSFYIPATAFRGFQPVS